MAPPIQLGIGLSLARAGGPGLDADAAAYIAAVEAADAQTLESGVKAAYDTFIRGCKADGIWDAIKASCILAGARTLSGALVPLKGTAPTNNNFVSGDYDRETGLVGDGSTKYLDSNYALPDSLTNNRHSSAWVQSAQLSGSFAYFGSSLASSLAQARSQIIAATPNETFLLTRLADATSVTSPIANNVAGFQGISRSNSANYTLRASSTNTAVNTASTIGDDSNMWIFARNNSVSSLFTNARLSFYSIGESLDLAALDSRVSTLISDIAAAIP